MYKKNKKKYLAIILTLAMAISLLPVMTLKANAEDITPQNGNIVFTGTNSINIGDHLVISDAYRKSLTGVSYVAVYYTRPQVEGVPQYADIYEKNTDTYEQDSVVNYDPDSLHTVQAYFMSNIAGTYKFFICYVDDLSDVLDTREITVTVGSSNTAPTVSTQAVNSIAATTATGNGNITALGSSNPTAYGVCWNTTGTPTTSDSKTDNGAVSATGAFTAAMTGLTANTTYHVRAYATNSAGTSYGTEVTFTTSEQHTLTFDSEGGSNVDAVTQNYNTQVTKPGDPTRTGCTFGGWYDGDNGTGNTVTFPYTLTADKTVYAKWTANNYTVTYDPGTGTVSPTTQTKLFGSTYGKGSSGTTDEAMPTPTQSGYTFGGWYTGEGGTGSLFTDTTTVATASNHTLYAKWTIDQHTLTFDSEGGSNVDAVTQNYNTQVTKPGDPIKIGYTFGGWYDGDNGTGHAVTFPYTLTADKTIYSKWTNNTYTVTYDPGTGSVSPTTQTKLFGSTYGKGSNGTTDEAMPTPTQSGYTFGGWYTGEGGTGSLVTDTTTVATASNHMLYAKWTIDQHTLTFDSEGGSNVDAVTQNYSTQVTKPGDPTRTGYTFGGWYDGDNGTGHAVTFPYTLTADKTVYAKWTANTYTVTYDPGTGTVSPTTQTKLFGSTYGKGSSGTTDEAMPTPTQSGYTFGGWYTGAGGTGSLVTDTTTVATASNHTLYAKWTINQHTLTFDSEGGSNVDAVTQNHNTQVSEPAAPTKTGYTFGGWYDGDNGTGHAVTFPYALTADKTIYAKWTANTYTVTYDPGTGSVSPTTQTKLFGSTYGKGSNGTTDEAMPTPTQSGYTFGGWYTGAGGTGSLVTGTTTVATASNHTLYAKWTIDQHTLTFDSEGGSAVNAVTQNYNTQVSEPAAPIKTGYTFGGWYDGDNGTGHAVTFPYALTADKTVYAKWTTKTYTVTYKNNYSNTDSTDYTTQTVTGIKAVNAPAQPTRTGYTFGGWYTNNTCTDAWNFKNNMVAANVVLYAKWTAVPVPKYTITYAPNGATSGIVPVDSNDYAAGSTARVNANIGSLAKAGYTFSGWNNNGTVYMAGQAITVSEDITLKAVWTAVAATYTVTYSNNYNGGGTYTMQSGVSSGSTLTAPSKPSRIGYSFIGWYKDAACINLWNFNFDTAKADTILYAKWAASIYTVSGNVVDDQVAHTAISGAAVKVVQGNIQFGNTATTDDSGHFTISGVPDGTYNLVVKKENQEVTVCITISGGNYTYTGSITLPRGNKNSKLDVIGSETPNVVVDNLNNVFSDSNVYGTSDQSTVSGGGTVEIKLTVQKNDNSANKATVEAAMSSGGYTAGTILDVDLTKTSTSSSGASEKSSITATSNLIRIIIPLPAELQGKASYVIYRAHDYGSGVVTDTITTTPTPNTNGEYIIVSSDKTQITAYLKYFSTYAIAYTNGGTTPSTSSSGGGSAAISNYVIMATSGTGGSISPSGNVNVMAGQSKTYTITVNNGYYISNVLVDGKSVGAVKIYTFSNVSAAHTIEAVFAKTAGLPYYTDDKGNNVFIGFASDVGGTMKYIAPQGKTVRFKENPKSFTDISSHWAKSYIDFVTQRELFLGISSNLFSPDAGMTRAMFATVIGRLYERSYGKIATTGTGSKFSDVDYAAYYGNYVDWAAENNIVTGVGSGKFEPDRKITREEMAVMLYRFAEFLKLSTITSGTSQLRYPDASAISSWATDAAKYCQQTGIISGRDGGNFVPRGTATRAEVAVILQRFIENTVN